MKTAYFDLISGASGDMIIGSLLNCGLSLDDLETELAKLPLKGYSLSEKAIKRHHIAATKFYVQIEETHSHRGLKDIYKIIDDSTLKLAVKDKCKLIFGRLAEAEAKVHGETIETVHFHEVGMVDAIVDICGAVIGLDLLGIEKVYCSELTVGKGTVETQHGTMPVPAPATAELIKGFPVRQTNISQEILTPTGAAILTTLADFDKMPVMKSSVIGYGAGTKEFKELPNLLRLFIGESESGLLEDEITLLETNLDRTSPEHIGFLMENLLLAGALDVFVTPILMKKNRPAQMLSILCETFDRTKLADIIFSSGATLGLRVNQVKRWKLERELKNFQTAYGEIPVKLAYYNDRVLYFPEYDVVAEKARQSGKSFDEIYFEIVSQLRKEK